MSRAFVKESDGDGPDDLPELLLSPHPNYVTSRGLALLQERLQQAAERYDGIDKDVMGAVQERALLAREIRWLQARIASALLRRPEAGMPQYVGFGCMVELMDAAGLQYRYQIVGEDEADPEQGKVSWLSPLARAIEGKTAGDEVRWPRPAGDLVVEILKVKAGAV